MPKINIQGLTDILDPFYRYRMEKINVIRQKTKTVIDNIDIICKDLERDPLLLVQFLKKKLNVSLTYKNNLLSMTANVPYETFELYLREFIELYVLCEICKLPETVLDNDLINFTIFLNCKCCSHKTIRKIKK